MDIVILADFLGPLDGTFNSRFLYLADMLAKDHNVEIITSDFDHGRKDYFNHEIEKHAYSITLLHEGSYSRNISPRRFVGHYIWGLSVKKYLKNRKKPDVIYCAIPTLTASYVAAKYCELNNVRFVIDVQDLWPEAFSMVFNVPFITSILYSPLRVLANSIYQRADEVIAVSETYVNRVLSVNNKVKQGTTVFLGTDLSQFDENVRKNPVSKGNELWIGYCGSMGDSYDLGCVINALSLCHNPPKFIAIGEGQKRKDFEQMAEAKGIQCLFTGKLPYDKMCGWLSKCDMVVNPIVGSSAASIINKHADYAAVGLPVLNTQTSEEYKKLVTDYSMGFNCNNGDSLDLAKKIELLCNDKALREKMGKNARKCAEEKFDRERSYLKIVRIVTSD